MESAREPWSTQPTIFPVTCDTASSNHRLRTGGWGVASRGTLAKELGTSVKCKKVRLLRTRCSAHTLRAKAQVKFYRNVKYCEYKLDKQIWRYDLKCKWRNKLMRMEGRGFWFLVCFDCWRTNLLGEVLCGNNIKNQSDFASILSQISVNGVFMLILCNGKT